MIEFEFRKCPVVNGVAYPTLPEAQRGSLLKLCQDTANEGADKKLEVEEVVSMLMQHADEVIAILSQRQVGRPRGKSASKRNVKTKPKLPSDLSTVPPSERGLTFAPANL